MSKVESVTITKAANIYFDGKVTSRSIQLADGRVQSLGNMLPGEFEFGTDAAEIVEILSGELEVLLPDSADWQVVKGGESFEYQLQQSSS